jgi:hypothetical protein
VDYTEIFAMPLLKRLKNVALWCLYLVGLIVFTFGGLKIIDHYFLTSYPLFLAPPGSQVGTFDPRRPGISVNTLTFYPFTGGHTQANFSIYGGKVRSGDHGFNVDFDLDHPPAKVKGEYRIVMIGGSAAWGWVATANEKMMYQVIERTLTKSLPCGDITKVRVINLAMNRSTAFQNFVALNLWGHELDPDAIVSFSGNNDSWLPPFPYFGGLSLINGLLDATHPANTPGKLKPLFKRFPGIFEHTGLGFAIRSLFISRYEQAERAEYRSRFMTETEIAKEKMTHKVDDPWREIVPTYVKAHKSIKRDFSGIPMLVAFQPYMARPTNRGQSPLSENEMTEYIKRYETFIEKSSEQLTGYINDQWIIFNVHEFYALNLLEKFPPGDGVHLDDEKQRIIGEELARRVLPWICGNSAKFRNRSVRP